VRGAPPSPRDFLENFVRPDFDAWNSDLLNERLAKNAIANLNNLSARAFHYLLVTKPNELAGAVDEGSYRNVLSAKYGNEFQIIRDVAEAHKHITLRRSNRVVTSYDQTKTKVSTWGTAKWGVDTWGGKLVVTLDDGVEVSLRQTAEVVFRQWEELLQKWGV